MSKGKKRDRAAAQAISVGTTFRHTFIALLCLAMLLLLINVGLVVGIEQPNDQQADLIDKVATGWWSAFTALLGLVGGKALQ